MGCLQIVISRLERIDEDMLAFLEDFLVTPFCSNRLRRKRTTIHVSAELDIQSLHSCVGNNWKLCLRIGVETISAPSCAILSPHLFPVKKRLILLLVRSSITFSILTTLEVVVTHFKTELYGNGMSSSLPFSELITFMSNLANCLTDLFIFKETSSQTRTCSRLL